MFTEFDVLADNNLIGPISDYNPNYDPADLQ